MLLEFLVFAALLFVVAGFVVLIWRTTVYSRRMLSETMKMRRRFQDRYEAKELDREREFLERKAKFAVREGLLQNRADQILLRENELESAKKNLDLRERQLRDLSAEYARKLENVAGTTFEEARAEIVRAAEANAVEEARQIRHKILEQSETDLQHDANRILLTVMQRIAPRMNEEQSGSIVEIPAEEVKGRLIGREGRNIRSFEQVTGATLIIDDTPGSVLVSCFDPFRRHIAMQTLRHLIEDGRIHPQSIEAFYEEAKNEAQKDSVEIGTRACDSVGVYDVPENIRILLGRLQYRLSYNQNTLDHSIETAKIAGTLASEMGLNVDLAKRAGLFHDIGKAINEENEESHALAGARVLRMSGEAEAIVNAVEGHHNDVPHTTLLGSLVMVADSISATRPGARTFSTEGYIERMTSLENIARRFEGVTDAFAIQAGRELRVIVSSAEVDDVGAHAIALKIRRAIEEELTYPGKIHILVIRELRVSEEAR
ncbi:MAG: ribonuclease Y [Opitutales bacterium]|nr:ribonuclease Y [Opitutales bacterium]